MFPSIKNVITDVLSTFVPYSTPDSENCCKIGATYK